MKMHVKSEDGVLNTFYEPASQPRLQKERRRCCLSRALHLPILSITEPRFLGYNESGINPPRHSDMDVLTEIQCIPDYDDEFYSLLPGEKRQNAHTRTQKKKGSVEIPAETLVSQGVGGDLKVMRSAELKLSFSTRLYLSPRIWAHLEISLNMCYNRPTPQRADNGDQTQIRQASRASGAALTVLMSTSAPAAGSSRPRAAHGPLAAGEPE